MRRRIKLKEKLYTIRCLNPNCGKILAYFGKIDENIIGFVNDDIEKRFFTDEKGSYIVCKFCGKKNAFKSNTKKGIPVLILSHIRED
jgi:hypothetical protein